MQVDKLRITRCASLLLAVLLVWAGIGHGYPVGPALSLKELVAQADVIFKGTVVSSRFVEDASFKTFADFAVRETQFRVVSLLQGESSDAIIRFRHYAENPQSRGRMYQPQYYRFEPKRTYIVFAKQPEEAEVYHQLWVNHKTKEDQGVLLCADERLRTATSLKETLWLELSALIHSADRDDVCYGVHQLDQMSGEEYPWGATQDFERSRVLALVRDLARSSDPKIARAAITVIGSHNPYMSDERTEYWLATIGSAEIPGLAKMDVQMKNMGGALYWQDLVTIANSRASAKTRALAIRALGLVREPRLRTALEPWLAHKDAELRAAATVLLADFPGPDARQHLVVLADDPAPAVRACVARAIGFSQQSNSIDLLDHLLVDEDSTVRRMACVSLLSFSPTTPELTRVFQSHLGQAEFKPLFLNALARENPEPYLGALARVVEEKTEPQNWGGGEIPAYTAWKILFSYLQTQSSETLASGQADQYLDALEKVGNYSSSNPRDIYAFYILRGMTDRAKRFREKANRAARYDLDHYFKQVDQNPSHYLR